MKCHQLGGGGGMCPVFPTSGSAPAWSELVGNVRSINCWPLTDSYPANLKTCKLGKLSYKSLNYTCMWCKHGHIVIFEFYLDTIFILIFVSDHLATRLTAYHHFNRIISLVPRPSQLFNVAHRKQEGLGDNVTCVICIWLMYNYRAWKLGVLPTSTEPLVEEPLAGKILDPRLVILANSVACCCEAFSHYHSRLRYRSRNRSIVAWQLWWWQATIQWQLNFDHLLSSNRSVTEEAHIYGISTDFFKTRSNNASWLHSSGLSHPHSLIKRWCGDDISHMLLSPRPSHLFGVQQGNAGGRGYIVYTFITVYPYSQSKFLPSFCY